MLASDKAIDRQALPVLRAKAQAVTSLLSRHLQQNILSVVPTSGYTVNSTSIFSWFGEQSHSGDGVWGNLAPVAKVYDAGICDGHTADASYHHHFSECWAPTTSEDCTEHSEIYSHIADDYPIYGPYEDTGTLAKSYWIEHNYNVSGGEAV